MSDPTSRQNFAPPILSAQQVMTGADHVQAAEKLLDLEQWHRASLELAEAARLDPNASGLIAAGVRLYLGQRRNAEALQEALRGLSQNPTDFALKFYCAVAQERNQQLPAAIQTWRELCQAHPDQAHLHSALADAMFWSREPEYPRDDIRIELETALRLDPNDTTAQFVRFWLANDANDEATMLDALQMVAKSNPNGLPTAQLLARWYESPRRQDLAEVGRLLRQFPADPELQSIAERLERTHEWRSLLEPHLDELFTIPLPNWAKSTHNVLQRLETAATTAPSFAGRKLARRLLELDPAESWSLAFAVITQADRSEPRRVAYEPLVRWVVHRALSESSDSPRDQDRLIRHIFRMSWSALFRHVLVELSLSPQEETWAQIIGQIIPRRDLLDEVSERYAVYKTPPPLPIDLIVDVSGFERQPKLRKSFLNAARHILSSHPDQVATVWALLLSLQSLPPDKDLGELRLALVDLILFQDGLKILSNQPTHFALEFAELLEQVADPNVHAQPEWSALFEALLYPPPQLVNALRGLQPENKQRLVLALSGLVPRCASQRNLWRRAFSACRLIKAIDLATLALPKEEADRISALLRNEVETAFDPVLSEDLRDLVESLSKLTSSGSVENSLAERERLLLERERALQAQMQETSRAQGVLVAQAEAAQQLLTAAQVQARIAEATAWYQAALQQAQSSGLSPEQTAARFAELSAEYAQRMQSAQNLLRSS